MREAGLHCFFVILLMKTAASQDDEISRWAHGIRSLLKGCPRTPSRNLDQQDFLPILSYCLQHRAIAAVDALLMNDVIPILDGINLVRYKEDRQSNTTDEESDRNQTKKTSEKNVTANDEIWRSVVMTRFRRLFRTHVLKIDLEKVSALGESSYGSTEEDGQGRRRRQKNKGMMFSIIMMGFLFMGTVLIPMGFQFLAVLGGKALILAKMALMLSSIQGLKKIATSGVNYGLYHSPVSAGWHDRSHQETQAPVELPFYQTYSPGRSPL